jgi:hypothetical protein
LGKKIYQVAVIKNYINQTIKSFCILLFKT